MSKFARYAFIALVALAFTACDSNEDDVSDAERFEGTWTLRSVSDAGGDKTALLQQAGDFGIVFEGDDDFVLSFDPVQGDAQTLSNTYAVQENLRKLTLNATVEGQGTVPIILDYDFSSDDVVTLSMPASYVQIVSQLLPPFAAFEGDVELTMEKV